MKHTTIIFTTLLFLIIISCGTKISNRCSLEKALKLSNTKKNKLESLLKTEVKVKLDEDSMNYHFIYTPIDSKKILNYNDSLNRIHHALYLITELYVCKSKCKDITKKMLNIKEDSLWNY